MNGSHLTIFIFHNSNRSWLDVLALQAAKPTQTADGRRISRAKKLDGLAVCRPAVHRRLGATPFVTIIRIRWSEI